MSFQLTTKNRAKSFSFAWNGFLHALKTQPNFLIQGLIGILTIIAAWFFGFNRIEWLVLLITIAMVLTAELLNTVIEVVVDLAVKEKLLPDARIAKDVSASMVLLISFFAILVGLILFSPHLFNFLITH